MYSLFAATLVASLAPKALANLYITSPVASTSCASGQPCNVAWNDDGQKPSLSDIGACTVGLFVGSQTQQTLLQDLGPVDVSKQASAQFNPVASIGPNGNQYFLRFTSTNFKDPANPQYNFEGFTAKFALTGMTGQFNATIQQQIDGASAPATPSGTGSAAAPSGSPSATSKPTSASSSTSAASKSSGTPSGTSNAGDRVALVGHNSALVALMTVAITTIAAALSV